MKTSCILLALLFGFLAGYPCSDTETCTDEKNYGIEVNASNHEHSADEVDLCSPLCVCSCCSHQINQPTCFHFEAEVPDYVSENALYVDHFIKSVSHSIWQPPRLV